MENSITHSYHIGGMSCSGCAATVSKKLSQIPEVISVDIDLTNKKAKISSTSELSIERLKDALSSTRYSID